MTKETSSEEHQIETDADGPEQNQHSDEQASEPSEEKASRKKRIGFWGWLLIILLILAAIIGLTLPRMDRNSELYQRATSVPYVGDYVATLGGGSTQDGVAESGSTDDSSLVSGSDGSDAQSENGTGNETAQEQVETAQNQVEEAGEQLENEVNAQIASTNSDEAEGDESSDDGASSDGASDMNSSASDGDETGSDEAETDAGQSDGDAVEIDGSVEEQNAQLKAQIEELQKELDTAQAGQSNAKSSQVISNLQIAAISGMSLEGAISEAEAEGIEVPEDVKAQISGVPTAIQLQNEFGQYATDALRAAKIKQAGDGLIAGIRGRFSAEYVGRSLTPQEGNTPDAVLSRAEEALRNGNLEQCLSDIATLPSEAQEAMQPWTEQANARLDVLKSIETMFENNQAN